MFHFLLKIKAKAIINTIFNTLAKKEPVIDWGLKHGMYAYEADSALRLCAEIKALRHRADRR